MTTPVARRLSDRSADIWGTVWSAIVLIALGLLWVLGNPLQRPVFSAIVLVGVFLSAFLTRPISRIDATLVLSIGPATLFLVLDSTSAPIALALWGTAYSAGVLVRVRNVAETAEVSAYVIGCALVSAGVYRLIDPLGAPTWVTAIACVLAYVLTRLIISSIRLGVVTELSPLDALRMLLPKRIGIFIVCLTIIALTGDLMRWLIIRWAADVGAHGAGALTVLLIGIATFALAMFYESRLLNTQLRGTLEAALSLPWDPNTPVLEQAVEFTKRTLPHYTIDVRNHAGRNINEITSPLDGGFLIARRGSSQPPFLSRDQHVLDAMTHIAETMGVVNREHDRLKTQAVTDELTGLPNYRGFRAALQRIDLQAVRNVAIAYIDIDDFKEINDTYGHDVGNVVLQTLATRMRASLPGDDVVARVGGDEFVVVLTGVEQEHRGRDRIDALLAATTAPIPVGEGMVAVSMSYGLAFSDSADTDMATLVTAADSRMYAGRGRELHDQHFTPAAREAGERHDAITRTVQERLITCVYQPIVDAAENQIVAVEVLVRPGRDAPAGVSAETIINEARRLGSLSALSLSILHTAVADMRSFHRAAPGLATLHLNIDVEQVIDPEFTRALLDLHLQTPVDITVELGETSLHRISDPIVAELDRLRGHGIRVALDDFGSSSSTLRAIIDIPLDVLKVDKSMVQYTRTQKPRLIIRHMAQLCAELGVQMVIEGVEEEHTATDLAEAGVRYMQGYRFGFPLPAEQLLGRLTDHGLRARLEAEPLTRPGARQSPPG